MQEYQNACYNKRASKNHRPQNVHIQPVDPIIPSNPGHRSDPAFLDLRQPFNHSQCTIFSGLWASSTCTNEPTGEELCAGHVSGAECDGDFRGWGYNQIVLETDVSDGGAVGTLISL